MLVKCLRATCDARTCVCPICSCPACAGLVDVPTLTGDKLVAGLLSDPDLEAVEAGGPMSEKAAAFTMPEGAIVWRLGDRHE